MLCYLPQPWRDVLEKLRDIRMEHVSASGHQTRGQRFVLHRVLLYPIVLVSHLSVLALPPTVLLVEVASCHGKVRFVCFYYLELCQPWRE